MASPSYILLCKSTSIDKDTNDVSVFNIVEKIHITPVPPEQTGRRTVILWQPLKLIVEWLMGLEDDVKDDFDFEFYVTINDKTDQLPIKGTFRFEAEKPRHRFIITFPLPFHFDKYAKGIMVFESRVKKTVASEWLRQSYSVLTELAVDEEKKDSKDSNQSLPSE